MMLISIMPPFAKEPWRRDYLSENESNYNFNRFMIRTAKKETVPG